VATSGPLNRSWLPSETFEMKSRILTLSVTKLRYNSGNSLKTSELFFFYGDIHYITYSFCKKCAKDNDTKAVFTFSVLCIAVLLQ